MKRDIARLASLLGTSLVGGKRIWLLLITVTVVFFISSGTTSAQITTLIPSSIIAGSPDFTLTILGEDLDPFDRILWNRESLSTIWDSSHQIRALVPARLIASPGSADVTLDGRGGFNTLVFTINPSAEASLRIEDVEVKEGETGTVNAEFTVSLSAAIGHLVTVDYATVDGVGPFAATAADNDYITKSGTLTFQPNQLQLTVAIAIVGDTKAEADERLFVNLTNPVGANIAKRQALCTIANDDFIFVRRCSTDVPKAFAPRKAQSTLEVPDNLILKATKLAYSTDNTFLVEADLTAPGGSSLNGIDLGQFKDCLDFPPITTPLGSGESAQGIWTLTARDVLNLRPRDIHLLCWCLGINGTDSGVGLNVRGAISYSTALPLESPLFNNLTVVATVISDRRPISNAQVSFFIRDKLGNSRIIKEQTTDSRGLAAVTYTRDQPVEDRITAVVRVDGVILAEKTLDQTIIWRSLECPILMATGSRPGESTLNVLHKFRDDELSQTPRGRQYTQLYYQFSDEAVRTMMFNPMLLLRSREAIERYKPVIQAMADGNAVNLTSGDLDEIEGLLNLFAAKASTEFRATIHDVCRDLRDPEVHAEFGITVTDGPKREVSVASAAGLPTSIIHSLGAALGLFALVFVRRRRMSNDAPLSLARGLGERSRNGREKMKRILSLTRGGLLRAYSVLNSARAGGSPRLCDGSKHAVGCALVMLGLVHWLVLPCLPANRFHSRVEGSRTGFVSIPPTAIASPTALNNLPLQFEATSGAQFRTRSQRRPVLLDGTEVTIGLSPGRQPAGPGSTTEQSPQANPLRMKLVDANKTGGIVGLQMLPGVANYFIGQDRSQWRSGIATYARVKAEQVYPGIDIVYYGNQGQLEYDFIVAPKANPEAIAFAFEGADSASIDSDGDLVLHLGDSQFRQHKPVAYQQINGERRVVKCNYELVQNQVAFELGDYDRSAALIIDPVLSYSTYLGGGGDDEGNSIAVDSAGNVYVIGFTDSSNFPLAGAAQPALGGGQQDVFVTKLNPTGTGLVYSTYLGGNGQDNGSSISVDAQGNAYITGFTGSSNFPVLGALQPAKNGQYNAFVAKLGPTGSLLYSTHLGGSVGDYGSSIAVDSQGNVCVAGVATSPNFPMANAIQSALAGAADVYVAKINAAGNRLLFSSYLGGVGNDGATSIALDQSGNVYLTGVTSSPNLRTANALQPTHGGGTFDGFVIKIGASNQLVYSTYLGGSGEDRAFRIAADSAGNAYVTGDTDSANFPTTAAAAQRSIGGSADSFIAKIDPSGSQLVYSTYLGGSGIDGGTAIAVDQNGNAYITGFTGSSNLPVEDPAPQSFGGGSYDAFVSKLNASGSSFEYLTYLGGSGIDAGFGVAIDPSGNPYVMGQTDSTDFPTAAPLQNAHGGGASDVFISKIAATTALRPRIIDASLSGKNLLVVGTGFDSGAKILVNGEQRKTANDEQNPSTTLIAKKAGKAIGRGETVSVQVRNSDGTLSNVVSFTRP